MAITAVLWHVLITRALAITHTDPSCLQRPTQIKIRAQDVSGKRMEVTFEGWEARIFQHEFDHLQVGFWTASTVMSVGFACFACVERYSEPYIYTYIKLHPMPIKTHEPAQAQQVTMQKVHVH